MQGISPFGLLSAAPADLSPLVKGIGKLVQHPVVYGVGTGLAGLDGINQIVDEARAAYAIYKRPYEIHDQPSAIRVANGIVNVAGYTLYGAGSAGAVSSAGTGAGLLLVALSNIAKQHLLPEREKYIPALPLHHIPATVPSLLRVRNTAHALTPDTPSLTADSADLPARRNRSTQSLASSHNSSLARGAALYAPTPAGTRQRPSPLAQLPTSSVHRPPAPPPVHAAASHAR